MGKGDRKTAKGKRNISSYGNVRSAATKKATDKAGPVKTAKAPVAAKKAPAKAAPAKKTAAR